MRSRGGKRQWTLDPEVFEAMEIRTLEDCREYMNRALVLVAQGKLNPTTLQAMSSAITAMARLIDMSDLDKRIGLLEDKVNKR